MAEQKIFGYPNTLSIKQGEEIDFHVNCDGSDFADAQLVRLIHGDEHLDGPGFVEEEIDNEINGQWPVKKQFTQMGSFLQVDDPSNHLKLDDLHGWFKEHPWCAKAESAGNLCDELVASIEEVAGRLIV